MSKKCFQFEKKKKKKTIKSHTKGMEDFQK